MNATQDYLWDTREGRIAIYRAIMKHLYKNEPERQRCLDNVQGDTMVRTIMTKEGLGEIPPGRKVIFLPEDDYDQGEMPIGILASPAGAPSVVGAPKTADTDPSRLTYRAGSSLIINLPPADEDPEGDEILDYACSYIIWIPQTPSKKASSQKSD